MRTVRSFAGPLAIVALLVPPVLAPQPPAVAATEPVLSDGPRGSGGSDEAAKAAAETALALPHEPDRLLVLWDPDTSARARARVRSRQDLESFRTVSRLDRRTDVVELPAGTDLADAITAWSALPSVRAVEPDYLLRPTTIPNDPDYGHLDLWGMRGPGTTPASPFGSRADEAWADGHTGSRDVHVVVIDEGLQTDHPDLAANVWINPFEVPGNRQDDDGNGYIDDVHGWDFRANDASVYDGSLRRPSDRHGAHVAGIIGAVGGNEVGVIGVAPRVTLISAKFLGPNGNTISNAIRAIDYATDLKVRHGIDIVATNNSWGGGRHSEALHDAIRRGGDAGILFVAAAGNDGADSDLTEAHPAGYDCSVTAADVPRGWDCVVAVASITNTGALSSFSNSGATTVDLGAPGSGVRSTVSHSSYGSMSGTSMAAPHVSGALALCAAAAPDLTAGELVERLYDSVAPTASLAGRTRTGGRLDVAALLESCDGFRVAGTVLPPLTAGQSYAATLRATGGTGALTWAIDGGGLPAGIVLDDDGTLRGTPSAEGTASVTIRVTDAEEETATRAYDLTVRGPLAFDAALANAREVAAGGMLDLGLAVEGGLAPYRWSIESGVLPAGVALSSGASGTRLVGTPTLDGVFPLRLLVADTEGRTAEHDLTLTVTPSDLQPVAATPDVQVTIRRRDASPAVVVPIARRVSGTAFPGVTVQGRWRLVGTSSWTNASGRTGSDGTVRLTGPTYRNAMGRSIEFCLTSLSGTGVVTRTTGLDCAARVVTTPVAIVTSSLTLERDVTTPVALSATGGLAPYSWTLVSGALPAGVSLAADGRVEGTPSVAGSFTVTVRVSDAGTPALTAERRVTLTVREPRFVEVAAIVVTTRTRRGSTTATATVSVVDAATGRAVPSATVRGTFAHSGDGSWAPSASVRTSRSGQARLSAPGVRVSDGTTFAFCVTDVRLSGWRAATTDPVCSPLP